MRPRDESNQRVLSSATDITQETLRNARAQWVKHNVMRQVLKIEIDAVIEQKRGELENCAPEEIHQVRGMIKGLRQAKATIDAQGPT